MRFSLTIATFLLAAFTNANVVHHEGETCGGFLVDAPVCAPGLVCVRTSLIADLPGICKKPTETKSTKIPSPTRTQQVNGEGGSCGGFVLPPAPICSPGLVCVYENTQIADLPGICRKPAKTTTTTTIAPSKTPEINGVGGRCCGFVVPPAPECSPGLLCNCPPNDSFGVCYDPKATSTKTKTRRTSTKASPTVPTPTSGLGGPCGGMIYPAAVCKPGLVCRYPPPPILDSPGTCVDPKSPTPTFSPIDV
ncbi:hypothetical protein HK098_005007 [Nowakowskiella sp. JEL0407]|nr:hypothetical protein HK098_005007 [Nowakowskiella sp. JEL0407]